MKSNTKLNRFLENFGYSYLQKVNIFEHGLTQIYKKTIDGKKLFLHVYRDNRGTNDFIVAKLAYSKKLYKISAMNPRIDFSIRDITFPYFSKLPKYEEMMIKAIRGTDQIKLENIK